jgi:protein KRI1
MSKRKADTLSQPPLTSGPKKTKHSQDLVPPKSTLLYDSDSASSSEDESGGGAKLADPGFKINEEYAKRFEHNKKRAELHRCQSIIADLGVL